MLRGQSLEGVCVCADLLHNSSTLLVQISPFGYLQPRGGGVTCLGQSQAAIY